MKLKMKKKRLKTRQPSPATAPKTDHATSASLNTSGGSFKMMKTGLLDFKERSVGVSPGRVHGEVDRLRFYLKTGYMCFDFT